MPGRSRLAPDSAGSVKCSPPARPSRARMRNGEPPQFDPQSTSRRFQRVFVTPIVRAWLGVSSTRRRSALAPRWERGRLRRSSGDGASASHHWLHPSAARLPESRSSAPRGSILGASLCRRADDLRPSASSLKGLIHRIPNTHRYTAISYGVKVAVFFAKLYLRILRPNWSALLREADPFPRALRVALDLVDREIQNCRSRRHLLRENLLQPLRSSPLEMSSTYWYRSA
jgi:hypothetical protein